MSFPHALSSTPADSKENIPQFWWNLSDVDKYRYNCLKINIASKSIKSQRNKRVETFSEILNEIKAFVVQGSDSNNVIRGLVCGICWLPEGIAINTHQLRFLISKCKSSINGSLQRMGFSSSLGRTETATALSNACPIFKDNTNALRKWTIRKRDNKSLSSFPSSAIPAPFQKMNSSNSFNNTQGNSTVFSIPLTGIAKVPKSTYNSFLQTQKDSDTITPESPPSSINTSPAASSAGLQCKVYTLPNISTQKTYEDMFTSYIDVNFTIPPLDVPASNIDDKFIESFRETEEAKIEVENNSSYNQIPSFINDDFGLMFNDGRIF
ncbi:hypothetical protein M9Y10_002751 [Tritrichomonas musculus]|uniref:Initiator binding domain-containing protein n=1 Tax=Tritrichomonas musculus TaxID=1915356 RepID=A0ABR2LAU4_9EUKA